MMEATNISNSIFILYMLIGANFLANLFGCRIQDMLSNNMLLKHIIGFMTLLFFVVMVDKSETTPVRKMSNTLVYYVVFLMTTRMDIKWWTPFIMSVFIVYILQLFKEAENDLKKKNNLEKFQKLLATASFIMIVIGVAIYIGRKKSEYKDSFSWGTFFVGKPSCRANSDGGETLTDFAAIRKAFNL